MPQNFLVTIFRLHAVGVCFTCISQEEGGEIVVSVRPDPARSWANRSRKLPEEEISMADNRLDLNQIVRDIARNRQAGVALPPRHAEKVFADRNGWIHQGSRVSPQEARRLTEIPQVTFAATGWRGGGR
jgi:hypothetical protein